MKDADKDTRATGDVGWLEKGRCSRSPFFRRASNKVDAEGRKQDAQGFGRSEGGTHNKRVFPVDATEFATAFGIGLLFALLRVEINAALLLSQSASVNPASAFAAEMAGLFSFCVTVVVCWFYSDRISLMLRRRFCIAGCAVLASLALVKYWVGAVGADSWLTLVLVEVADGVPYAIMLILWVAELWVLQRLAAARVLVFALFVSAAFSVIVSSIPSQLYRYSAMAVCLGLVGFSYLAASPHDGAREFVSREETRQNLRFDMRTSAALFVAAVAEGFCVRLVVGFGEASLFVIAAAFFLAAIIVGVAIAFWGDRGVLLGGVFRWMFPVLTACFILMPFADGVALGVCATVALAACFACLASLFVTTAQLKIRFEVQPIYVCSRVLLPWIWGALAGMALGFAAVLLSSYTEGVALMALSMLMAVLFSVAMAVAPYGIDMLTMPIEPHDEDGLAGGGAHGMHAWKTACSLIAREHGLTPREMDVFMLLAKGRNAKVIERELFISVYTIKGHNNSIYRKLGVRTQQELIDLVERYRHEIWAPSEGAGLGGDDG